jgi:hypothetical protein
LSLPVLLAALLTLADGATSAAPAARLDQAAEHYASGKALFDAGNRDQALVEFRLAYEKSGNVEALFGMAQCEYHLGRLQDARAHYQQYVESPKRSEQAAQIARLRIEAIDRRPGTVEIRTVPDDVDVELQALGGDRQVIRGQAPNRFEVPRGRYRVVAAKRNYVTDFREIDLKSGATEFLFFPLKPVPAHLSIVTKPARATLYVRGSRARNPYVQDVEAGAYEIYAEAPEHDSKSEVITLAPGERCCEKPFELHYVQRSGRPELIGFWTTAGAVAGGTAVSARLSTRKTPESVGAASTVVLGAAMVGGIGGALISRALVPDYIRDNLALFRIGAGWIGAAEGATLGLAYSRSLVPGWIGGVGGLAVGATLGTFLDDHAPNYGRVSLIQSSAAIGAFAGALAVPAFDLDSDKQAPLAVFGGLNLGLGVGLALAYLPDQRNYGPSWQHIMLINLAVAAGAVAGAVVRTVSSCVSLEGSNPRCEFTKEQARPTAQFALVGAGIGLAAGWLLTRDYDKDKSAPSERKPATSLVPLPTLLPVATADGGLTTAPGLAAQGRF